MSKQNPISSSSNTSLLCKTWALVSLGEIYVEGTVIFSEAGTYFISSASGNEVGTWQWCNSDENKISFTLDGQLNCDGIDIIREIELTENSLWGIDTENGRTEELIMKPKSSIKSALMSTRMINDKILGFNF